MQTVAGLTDTNVFNLEYRENLSRQDRAAGEAYRIRTTTPKPNVQKSMDLVDRAQENKNIREEVFGNKLEIEEKMKLLNEQNQTQIVKEPESEPKDLIDVEDLRVKLKEKGIKGVHLIKNPEKIVQKAKELGII